MNPEIKPGTVWHSVGAAGNNTYGVFSYHLNSNQVAVGYVVGLIIIPTFRLLKNFSVLRHPAVRSVFEGGRRVSYGARALNEGGFQSIPKLTFSGGCLVGCTAGFLNVPKIKGTHTAMKSGMLAAEAIFDQLMSDMPAGEASSYGGKIESSWLWDELYRVRNIRPAFTKGLWAGMSYAAIDTYLLRGRAPWTFSHHADHANLKPQMQRQRLTIRNLIILSALTAIHLYICLAQIMKKTSQPI